MEETDTLPNPDPESSSLQDVLTQARNQNPPASSQRREDIDSPSVRIERRRPPIEQPSASGVILEPVSVRKPYDLSYACLLIPRFSAHQLIGDIAEDLHEWMRRICISFEWRLDNLLVRPEYMQWVLYVPAATPPSRCIRTIRDETSRLIFDDFPQIKRENMSHDFWAPGYLVLVGPALHPQEMIEEYIRLTRQQQGIQPRLRE